jgi:transcriptional regulator with XRE-family HTH domain
MDSFGARLRHERERRKIALRSIAERTKISVRFLEQLERDDVSRWPSGLFRKSFVRAYATAIGLDPDVVLREFAESHPDPNDGAFADPALQTTTQPSGPVAVKLRVRWRGFPFASALGGLRKRWLSWRAPGVPARPRANNTGGYMEAIAAIMKVEEP